MINAIKQVITLMNVAARSAITSMNAAVMKMKMMIENVEQEAK